MKFSQIILLSAVSILAFSCRETLGEQHRNPDRKQAVPATEKKELRKIPSDSVKSNTHKPEAPKPVLKKKTKKQDTLKPQRAIP